MTNPDTEPRELALQLAENWGLAIADESLTLEMIQEWLGQRVAALLNDNPERLAAILYRLDVNEGLFKKALKEPDPARIIAGLIIERESQRQAIRKKYRPRPGESVF